MEFTAEQQWSVHSHVCHPALCGRFYPQCFTMLAFQAADVEFSNTVKFVRIRSAVQAQLLALVQLLQHQWKFTIIPTKHCMSVFSLLSI